MPRLWAARADLILVLILLTITGLYALLMAVETVPIDGLVALSGLWLLYWISTGRLSFATPLDLSILGILGLVPLSLIISIDWNLSLPFVYGLVLSIALFYVIVNYVRNYPRLRLAIWALILLAAGTALLGLLGTSWIDSKFAIFSQAYGRLPQLVDFLPIDVTMEGIHPNTTGGVLTFFLPLLGSLLWDGGAFYRKYQQDMRRPHLFNLLYKLVIFSTLLLVALTLLLTQSRSAYLGSAFGLMALAVWKDRRFIWLIPVVLVAGVLGLYFYTQGNIPELTTLLETSGETTLQDRWQIWQSAIFAIQDFPFTGMGIGTFGRLLNEIYTFDLFSVSGGGINHTHNTFLSVAVDLGIPALLLYSTALSAFTYMLLRSVKTGRSIIRTLAIGLACGMLAHQVYGITDAFVLGKKLGIVMWVFMGLAAALYVHRKNFYWRISSTDKPSPGAQLQRPSWRETLFRLGDLLLGLSYWLALSLAAIAFINLNPFISIAIALVNGALLGIVLVKRHQQTSRALRTDNSII